jgi:hypothetical protein
MKADMSAKAVTQRLKQVSELRELCLSLAKAGKSLSSAKAKKSSLRAKKK